MYDKKKDLQILDIYKGLIKGSVGLYGLVKDRKLNDVNDRKKNIDTRQMKIN